MFTGIIEDIGTIGKLAKQSGALKLSIKSALPKDSVRPGDSIAVNGACLTLTGFGAGALRFDVSHESLAATTLGALRPGDRVHLERALSFGGRVGGHLVTGHVDGVGEIAERISRGESLDLILRAPAEVRPFLVAKGSVAVDGVSLTVNEPKSDRFRVTLVPHTLQKTTLADRRPGERVNLEADLLGKYVRHFLAPEKSGGVTEAFLAEHGFLNKE
jgi:riboflavin synthase